MSNERTDQYSLKRPFQCRNYRNIYSEYLNGPFLFVEYGTLSMKISTRLCFINVFNINLVCFDDHLYFVNY